MEEYQEVIPCFLDDTNNHLFIETHLDEFYICEIYDHYYGGYFSKQWYGLNFINWGTSGIQLNHIQRVWWIKGFNRNV